MNILIPDNWLREYLVTKATPEEIKEYLSLSGPSVERIYRNGNGVVYDIEITTNRPDAMSVVGVAREAAAILPRFGIAAKLVDDPYAFNTKLFVNKYKKEGAKKLIIKTDPKLNPRWTSIVLTNVKVGPSPSWLTKRLEATGIRSLNNVIDITNYLMRAYGQPAHAFDYDEIKGNKMILRASRKGEKIITLDGKSHILPGGDIVIEDGDGRLIDLCGIMGGYNSSIKNSTRNVVLFMQTYNAANIRRTSMALAHRTEAAGLFEKGLDSTLVLPTIMTGVKLMEELAGARVASKLYDLYPAPYQPYTVSATQEKMTSYIGTKLTDKEIGGILHTLGFSGKITKTNVTVSVPSWRRDVTIDVDIIEEVARLYGYHNIVSHLPSTEPPVTIPNPGLVWEQEIKTRLRDWGFTELYTYSMISEKLMDIFGLDKTKAYKIANPLSEDWLYMRPKLWPSVLEAVKQNLRHQEKLQLFELSNVYEWRKNDLPVERPALMIVWTGHKFREAKGITESIFKLFGIAVPDNAQQEHLISHNWNDSMRLLLGDYGSVSEVNADFLANFGITTPVTIVSLYMDVLVRDANPANKYVPIPKYPPIIEDFSFVVTPEFQVGPFIEVLSKIHKLIKSVTLLDAYENKRTFRVTYLDPARTLTNLDIAPVHQKFLEYAAEKFGISPVI